MKYLNIIIILSMLTWFSFTSCNKENEPKPMLIDTDGNLYRVVTIGNQTWMAENLKSTKDNQGKSIPNITKNEEWEKLENNNVDKALCYYRNDVESKYGLLYTYAAAIKACPTGWHLPSDEEWTELEEYLSKNGFDGMESTALRARNGWTEGYTEDAGGTDNYGFSAIPGGACSGIYFFDGGFMGHWWTSTEKNDSEAYNRTLIGLATEIWHSDWAKSSGQSVRCIKDKG